MGSHAVSEAAKDDINHYRGNWEDNCLYFSLILMVLIPITEIILRGVFRLGIVNAASIVQHLVLVLGMLGAMVAAREDRLLAFTGLHDVLPETWRPHAQRFSSIMTLSVTLWLLVASVGFVETERMGDHELAYGLPIWIVLLIMPVGFAGIVWRTFQKAAPHTTDKVLILGGTLLLAAPWFYVPEGFAKIALILVTIAAMLGAPMFIVLGGAALILFAGDTLPIAAIPLSHYQLTVNPSLPAVPLFTLAGYMLAEGGAPKRLVRLFQAMLGRYGNGTVIMAVLLSAFFTSFTGASGVTILALGGLLMPMLSSMNYPKSASLGLLTSAPALGTLLPPALPLIIYAIVAKLPIETLFLAGLLPSVIMTILLTAVGIWSMPEKQPEPAVAKGELMAAILEARWEIAIPLLAFLSLMSGLMTPVETAAMTAAYAFIVEVLIHKDLSLKDDVPRVFCECGLMVGGIILILGMALGFTNYIADAQIPELATEWVERTIHTPWLFLLALNALLLLVGMLMDIFSAIVVITPLIAPMGIAFGIDPVHLGILFLANMELGFLTPPIGMNLFFASYRFKTPMAEVTRSVLLPLVALAIGVLLITYIPALSTALPSFFLKSP